MINLLISSKTGLANSFDVKLLPGVEYKVGDKLLPEDFVITYIDDLNNKVDVDMSQVRLSGFDSSTSGTKYVVVSYNNMSQVVPVLVKPNDTILTVTPAKSKYQAGIKLTTSDFLVYNGSDRVTDFDIVPSIFQSEGQHTVTITANGIQANTVIQVISDQTQPQTQEGYTISIQGDYKTEYYIGEQLDTSGVEVIKTTNSGKVIDVTKECKFNAPPMTQEGDYVVEITYKSQVVTYPITIKPAKYLNMEMNEDGTVTLHFEGREDETVKPVQVVPNNDGTYKVTAVGTSGDVHTENLVNYNTIESPTENTKPVKEEIKSERITALVPIGIIITVHNGKMAEFEDANIQSLSDVGLKVVSTPQEPIDGLGKIEFMVNTQGSTVMKVTNEPVKSSAYYAALNTKVEVLNEQ